MQQLLKRHGKPQLDPEMQELQRRVEDRALIRRSSSAHRVWTYKKNNSRKLRWGWGNVLVGRNRPSNPSCVSCNSRFRFLVGILETVMALGSFLVWV